MYFEIVYQRRRNIIKCKDVDKQDLPLAYRVKVYHGDWIREEVANILSGLARNVPVFVKIQNSDACPLDEIFSLRLVKESFQNKRKIIVLYSHTTKKETRLVRFLGILQTGIVFEHIAPSHSARSPKPPIWVKIRVNKCSAGSRDLRTRCSASCEAEDAKMLKVYHQWGCHMQSLFLWSKAMPSSTNTYSTLRNNS